MMTRRRMGEGESGRVGDGVALRFALCAWLFALCVGVSPSAWAQTAPAADRAAEQGSGEEEVKGTGKTTFYRLLARKSVGTVEDAIRVVARYRDYPGDVGPLEQEIEYLNKKGVSLPNEILKRRGETLTIGVACTMLLNSMDIKGGLMYRLFPHNQRYAVREATRLNLIARDSFVGQTMNGNELMGMMYKIVKIRNEQKEKEKGTAGAKKERPWKKKESKE